MISSTFLEPNLTPLPTQPEGVAWPTEHWPRGEAKLQDANTYSSCVDRAFQLTPQEGQTYALLVVQGSQLVTERYDHGANPIYLQYSWSMAKSIIHALVGFLIADAKATLEQTLDAPEWIEHDDPRRAITLHHALTMRDGLDFTEDYVDGGISDVIAMLFADGRDDTATYTASKSSAHPPGSVFNYSSGTTNLISRWLQQQLNAGPTEMLAFMQQRLFHPLGMSSATPRFDTAGTFIGSSYLFATPEDFARFGLLYLRGGRWGEQQLLPSDWIDYGRSESHRDAESAYGAHWWLHKTQPGWFYASGYDGQRIIIAPDKDVVVVRLGRTAVDQADGIWDNIDCLINAMD